MVILYDRENLPNDIFETIFKTPTQVIVAKELIKYMIHNGGEIGKTQMSMFATELHEGRYETVLDSGPYKGKKVRLRFPMEEDMAPTPKRGSPVADEDGLNYNKRQFYDRILTPMKSMGLIDYNLYKKTYKISTKFYNDMMKIGLLWKTTLAHMGHKEANTIDMG